jgi:hypothetical protein
MNFHPCGTLFNSKGVAVTEQSYSLNKRVGMVQKPAKPAKTASTQAYQIDLVDDVPT